MAEADQYLRQHAVELAERSNRVFELIALSSYLAVLRRAFELFHHDVNDLFKLPDAERRGRISNILALWSACREPIIQLKQQADDADYLKRSGNLRGKVDQLFSRTEEIYKLADQVHESLANQALNDLALLQGRFHNALLTISTLHQTVIHQESRELSSLTNRLRVRSRSNQIGGEIFLIHGHDVASQQSVARFLERLDLKVRILHEMPNAGRTIIEKFEDYSGVGYAVALLTGDDEANAKRTPNNKSNRARQNVVFELGYFIGKLGRRRVCALVESGVERPSDIDGVVYIPLDKAGAWKVDLARDIRNAGIEVDLNKLVEDAIL